MSTKKIVVQWHETPHDRMYPQTMFVMRSDHPRFVDESRFDYGFMSIAAREGYTVEAWPIGEGNTPPKVFTEEEVKAMLEEARMIASASLAGQTTTQDLFNDFHKLAAKHGITL